VLRSTIFPMSVCSNLEHQGSYRGRLEGLLGNRWTDVTEVRDEQELRRVVGVEMTGVILEKTNLG
jgi:hypothetical protein